MAGTCREQLQERRTAARGDSGTSCPYSVSPHPPSCLCEDPWLNPTAHLRQRSPLVSLGGPERGGGSRQGWTWRGRWQTPSASPPRPDRLAEPPRFGDEPRCTQRGRFLCRFWGHWCRPFLLELGVVSGGRVGSGFVCLTCWDAVRAGGRASRRGAEGLREESGDLVRLEARLRAAQLFRSRPELPELCYLNKRRTE